MCGGCDNCSFDKPKSMKLFYEIHVTVANDEKADKFLDYCENKGIKAILIANYKNGYIVSYDFMTSHKVPYGRDPFNELETLVEVIEVGGFNVVRKKIETVPWHPLANLNGDEYFEVHFEVKGDHVLAESLKFYVSKSARVKNNVIDRDTTMYTYRSSDREWSKEVFEMNAEYLTMIFKLEYGDKFDKVITEFAMYDSNRGHDKAWIV